MDGVKLGSTDHARSTVSCPGDARDRWRPLSVAVCATMICWARQEAVRLSSKPGRGGAPRVEFGEAM